MTGFQLYLAVCATVTVACSVWTAIWITAFVQGVTDKP